MAVSPISSHSIAMQARLDERRGKDASRFKISPIEQSLICTDTYYE